MESQSELLCVWQFDTSNYVLLNAFCMGGSVYILI